MKPGGRVALACAAIALAATLLSGCSPAAVVLDRSPLIPTEVAPDSRPAFVDDPQDASHPLPASVAEGLRLDDEVLATVRYQGDWYGQHLYLYDGHGTVILLGVELDDPDLWNTGSSAGNVPFAMESGDLTEGEEWFLQYVPQGTADLPDGWTAFSPWLASRDS